MCYEFIWDKKTDRIKRKYAVQSIENGGLAVPDIETYIKALKLMWIRKIYLGNPKWKNILYTSCADIDRLDVYGASKYIDNNGNTFWKDVFSAYVNFTNNVTPQDSHEVLAEPIFYNNKFKIGNMAISFRNWINKEIFLVRDIINEKGQFLDYKQFSEKYGIKVNFLDYFGCLQSVKNYLRKENIVINDREANKTTKALQIIAR